MESLLYKSHIILFSFSIGLPKAAAVFPLNQATRGKDLRKLNPSARTRNVKYAPGPYGRTGGSTRFLGRGNSYIQFPNRGGLDTRRSITILAWIYPEGRPGPIFNFHPNGEGIGCFNNYSVYRRTEDNRTKQPLNRDESTYKL